MLSTGADGTAQLVSEALRAGEGAVRPELLAALRAAAAAVLPMDAVRDGGAAAAPPPAVVRQTMVRIGPPQVVGYRVYGNNCLYM